MPYTRTILAMLSAAVLVAGAVSAAQTPRVRAEGLTAARVIAPPATPTPKPTPGPAVGGPPECPGLNNPGGNLRWEASADAGPWPTGGTVELPALATSAPLVKVGIDGGGLMVVPHNARDVAWLDQGQLPGQTNNIVVAGHIRYGGVNGAFRRIGELKRGDDVFMTVDGKRYHFMISWVCSFARDTEHADTIMGRTERTSLTLITCGGTFDRAARTHTNRIVARAELVEIIDA